VGGVSFAPERFAKKVIEFPQTGAVIQAIGSDYAGSAGANPVIGKRVQALPGNEVLGDLPLELNAVGTLSGHGFHPLKAQLTLSNH
jgi:hypothetical protein